MIFLISKEVPDNVSFLREKYANKKGKNPIKESYIFAKQSLHRPCFYMFEKIKICTLYLVKNFTTDCKIFTDYWKKLLSYLEMLNVKTWKIKFKKNWPCLLFKICTGIIDWKQYCFIMLNYRTMHFKNFFMCAFTSFSMYVRLGIMWKVISMSSFLTIVQLFFALRCVCLKKISKNDANGNLGQTTALKRRNTSGIG